MKKILIWISLFLLICLSVSYSATTLSEVRNAVRQQINDTGPTSSEYYFSDTTLNYWINEAQLKIIKKCLCVETRTHITTSSTTFPNEYILPATFLEILRVYIINTSSANRTSYLRLSQTNYNRLDKDSSAWDDAGFSTPSEYYIRYTTYSVLIGLYPPPDEDHAGTDFLRIDYVKFFSDMSSDSDEIFNGLKYLEPYQDLLVDYTVAKCKGDTKYIAIWELQLKELRTDIINNPDKRGRINPR